MSTSTLTVIFCPLLGGLRNGKISYMTWSQMRIYRLALWPPNSCNAGHMLVGENCTGGRSSRSPLEYLMGSSQFFKVPTVYYKSHACSCFYYTHKNCTGLSPTLNLNLLCSLEITCPELEVPENGHNYLFSPLIWMLLMILE